MEGVYDPGRSAGIGSRLNEGQDFLGRIGNLAGGHSVRDGLENDITRLKPAIGQFDRVLFLCKRTQCGNDDCAHRECGSCSG